MDFKNYTSSLEDCQRLRCVLYSLAMKIAVALSGGVDSFVCALLLKLKGYDVFGIYIQLSDFHQPYQAQEAAELLNIPLTVLDYRKEFKKLIIEPFLSAYLLGKTPNPCVLCNELIKFNILKNKALEMGADFFATGHYVRLKNDKGIHLLLKAADPNKDQSYFLHRLAQRHLERVIFPLGDLKKEEVYKIAQEYGFKPVKSRDVCFIKGNYRDFIKMYVDESKIKKGPIVDLKGNILGWHQGVHLFTVGQRHGLGLKAPRAYYVVKISGDKVIVGDEKDLLTQKIKATEVNWIKGYPPSEIFWAKGQIRYRQKASTCKIQVIEKNTILCEFVTPQKAVAPGQALVLYVDDELLGGGWINDTI